MRSKLAPLFFLSACALQSQYSLAQSNNNLPTHCKGDESVNLNAVMGVIVKDPNEVTGIRIVDNGKVLSLCVGRSPTRLVYRYGAIGKVEMERTATAKNKFWYGTRSFDPHTGDETVFFSSGEYTYYISQAQGQGHGVSLIVIKAGKIVVHQFSKTYIGSAVYEDDLASLLHDILVVKDVPDLAQ